ncbi:MAG: cation:proton antiporter, partial [Chthoniobacteraceae bacterium]
MMDVTFLRSLGLIVVTAALCALGARVVKMPAIVAYLFAGLLLGPITGWVEFTDTLDHVSEAGIALLLFVVGLELSFDKIRDLGRVAVLAGLGQIIFTAIGGFIFCWAVGFSVMDATFLSTALTFSSTVVVVKLLDDKKELDSLYGRIAISIFLMQDVVVILILTMLAGLGGSGGQADAATMARGLGMAFGGMGALAVAVLLAARFVLPRPFRWAARSPEMMFIWSLCWCFLIVLLAEYLHLSLEVGAFLAGISLAQLPYNHDLRRRVHPLMSFFIAVFLVSLGIKMDLGAAVEHWPTVTLLSLFVLIGDPIIFMWIIARMGYGEKTSFLSAVSLAQMSEFSFILVAAAASANLIGGQLLSIVALVGLVTISVSAFM